MHSGCEEDEQALTEFTVAFTRYNEVVCVVMNVELTQGCPSAVNIASRGLESVSAPLLFLPTQWRWLDG
jgi:hypothetical protein